jgi:hypothetical protein
MEKTKQLRKPLLIRILDFVSPHDLSKAIALLEGAAGYQRYDARLYPYELRVHLLSVDDDTYEFHTEWIFKSKTRLVFPYEFVKANGYLKRWDRKSTHVFGKVELPIVHCLLLTIVCTAGAFLGLYYALEENLLLGLVVIGLLIATLVVQLRALRDLQLKMAHIIVTALHPMPEQLGYERIHLKFGKPRHRHRS